MIDAINLIERSLNSQLSTDQVKQMLQKIEAITPDTENFDNASYALNACVAICESLDFLLKKDPLHIFNSGTCLTDTVDGKIQESVDRAQHEIDSHPEMINARLFLLEIPR